jgi:RHS repeat-associated protein
MTAINIPDTVLDGSLADNAEMMYYSSDDDIPGIGSPRYQVNTSTLRLFVHDTLYSYKGKGPAVVIALSYNHNPGRVGLFGRNWTSSYESTIEQSGESIVVTKESGARLVFRQGGAATQKPPGHPVEAVAPEGVFDRLIDYGTYWMYIIKDSRILLIYDKIPGPVARLSRISDIDNNMVVITMNPEGTIRSVTDACGRSTSFSYNTLRQCISVALPDGRTASFTYDDRQNLAQVIDFGGISATYSYDQDNAIVQIRKGQGPASTSFTYQSDQIGKHLRTITGPDQNAVSYEVVSVEPRHVRITDPEGGTLQYFSNQGKTTRVIDQLGNAVEFGIGGGKRTRYRDKNGLVTQLEYDGRGNMIRSTLPNGAVNQYRYDENDNLVLETDALGRQTTYQYDSRQHLIKTVTPANRSFGFEYDGSGQLVRMVDPSGKAITLQNDRFGNVAEIIDSTGYSVKLTYDPSGLRLTAETDARGNTRQYEYDGNDRIVGILGPDGSRIRYGYDTEGKLQSVDRNGNIIRFAHNAKGRVKERTGPLAYKTQFDYDRKNRLIARVDAMNRPTRLVYDPASRLMKLTNRLGNSVGFSHDNEGNLIRITDENGNATRYLYGRNYLIETITDALDRSVKIGQDTLGRVVSLTNARGSTVSQSYSLNDEISEKMYDGTIQASFSYDLSENLVSAHDSLGETTYSWSSRNLIDSIRYRDGSLIAFEYDENANIVAVTYPGNLRVQYTYDTVDRVSSSRWQNHAIEFFYDKSGSLVRESRSNSVESMYTFDSEQQLAGLSHRSQQTVLADVRYERDPVGNIVQESGVKTGPAPDPLKGVRVSPAISSFNSLNQVISSGNNTCTYDADGNLTEVRGSREFFARYDPENRPIEITCDGKKTVYEYGADGPRARKIRDGVATDYYYTPDGILLFEKEGTAGSARYFIYAEGYLVAMVTADNQTFFYHSDKTGNILAITDSEGNVAASYSYDPFGLVIGRSQTTLRNDFTYGGAFGIIDEGDGLYFMQNRYYDAMTGRFFQRDPVGIAGSLNLYRYCNNNPVAAVDPDGLGPKPAQRPQPRPGKTTTAQNVKNAIDNFVESTARSVANNSYVKKGWRFIDQTVGNYVRNTVSPYQNNNIKKTIGLAQQNVRSGGPPKIPASRLPSCSQIQGRTKQEVGRHILEGGRVVVDTVSGYNPALSGVPRALDAAQVLYNTTSGADPNAAKNAAGGYVKGQVESAIKATASAVAQGKDPTEDFDLVDHITNEITGN